MAENKDLLASIKTLGTAKIGGLVCNKRKAMVLTIDLEVPVEEMENTLDTLGLEPSKELMLSLETVLKGLKKQVK